MALTNATPHPMIRNLTVRLFAGLFFLNLLVSQAAAVDQAKAIVNALDPSSMNELFEVAHSQPDAALTNIIPVSANTFRFLFVWPQSNPTMTFDRVGRSFAERFAYFAQQWKLLAVGFCLSGTTMTFGTAPYGEEQVNVAYRDIEVRYAMTHQPACQGRYVSLAEMEDTVKSPAIPKGYSIGALPLSPAEGLKPFLPSPAQESAPVQ